MARKNKLEKLGVFSDNTKQNGVFYITDGNTVFISNTHSSFLKKFYELSRSSDNRIQRILESPDLKFSIISFNPNIEFKVIEERIKNFHKQGMKVICTLKDKDKKRKTKKESDLEKEIESNKEQIQSMLEYCSSHGTTVKNFVQMAITYFDSNKIFVPTQEVIEEIESGMEE